MKPSGRRLVPGLLLLATASVGAQAPAGVDSVFAGLDHTDGPGCTLGVEHHGRRTLRAWGMADLEHGLALHPASILETGSVAKQFTAAVVALLHQQGRLSLDDDIRRYLPEVPDFGRPITIRQLLTHTSGLRDQWGLLAIQGFPPGQEVHTFARILDLVSRQRRLNFLPGEEYLYSNTGYALAAIIVSRVTGKPFAEYSREVLFEPLGMAHTAWRDDYRRVVPDRATAYTWESGRWVQDMPFTMVHGNGGLLTTVGDLLTWNDALSEGRVPGGPTLVSLLETPGRLNDGSSISYALGLVIGTHRGLREVSHGGATAGYRTFLARWPERQLSVALLCNRATVNAARLTHQVADLVLGLGGDPAPPSPPVPVAVGEIADLAGSYRDSTSDQIVVFVAQGDRLMIAGGGGPAPLVHLGDLRFWHPQAGEYRFERVGDRYRVVQFADAWRRYEPFARPDSSQVRLADYLGRYRSPELEVTVEVTIQDGRLAVRRRPASIITLMPAYPDGFAGQGQTFRFGRDRRGQVTGFLVYAGRVRGLEFERLP